MFGLWETVAVAAGAASIPVIIHLLNRKRYRIVTWAAMKFLLAAQKQNTRRLRLEQIVLLAVRVLVVLLVVAAMASVMPWAEDAWAYFWPEGGGPAKTAGGRTHKILVLDASLSMNVLGPDNQTAFERAKGLAKSLVDKAPAGDGFSVALMKESSAWIVAQASPDRRKVAAEIEQLQATHGNASVPLALNMIANKLKESPSHYKHREVYFFTDMQQSTWAGSQAGLAVKPVAGKEKTPLQEIQKRARTIFVDVGPRDAAGNPCDLANLAISNLLLDDPLVITKDLVTFKGIVRNYSKETKKARLALVTGRAGEAGQNSLTLRVAREETVELRPGESAALSMPHKFSEAGTYVVQLRLLGNGSGQPADHLAADNVRSVVVSVRDQVPVMVVNGKPAVDRFDKASEFVRLALNPFPADATPAWVPLRPRVLSVSQFADAGEGDLSGFDCAFLCDVGQLGSGEVRRLENYVRRGGGLVVSVGDQVAEHLDVYNRLLFKKGLLPGMLVKKVQAPREHHFSLQADEDAFKTAPLKAFADDDDRGSLRNPHFRQYLEVKPVKGARVVMTFMPEVEKAHGLQPMGLGGPQPLGLSTTDPALMEWHPPLPRPKDVQGAEALRRPVGRSPARYRGKVILVSTSLNMDWNSWPASPSFGAMMQELARLGVSGKLKERSLLVGQAIEEFLPAGDSEVDVQVYPPSPRDAQQGANTDQAILEGKYRVRDFLAEAKKQRTQGVNDLTVLTWADTFLSGVYLLTMGRNGEEFPVAVNVPATTPDQGGSESNLTRVSKDKLREVYNGWDFLVVNHWREVPPPGKVQGEEVLKPGPVGPDVARYLFLVVLGLLFLEVVLAYVFGHYSAVGTTEPAAMGRLGPILVAGFAAVIFLAGVYVLLHAFQTGDFLGFLPEGARSRIESWLDIPPPGPGEAVRWELEGDRPGIGGGDPWLAGGVALAAALLIFFIYRAEGGQTSPHYQLLLGGLRLFLILLTLAVLLPQLQLRFDRQGWPDVVLLIDDSRSMGEPDFYQDEPTQEAVRLLAEQIRKREKDRLPGKIAALKQERDKDEKSAEILTARIKNLENQLAQINSPGWRPTRLQLVQALLAQEGNDWLQNLLQKRRLKLHIYHLDAAGRAIHLADAQPGEGLLPEDPQLLRPAKDALAALEAEGKESHLGSALRQVLDQYRGSSLASVIMFTDGVTTRDETIAQVADYARLKAVPLFFVGLGDDHPIRDLKLHDLQVEDVVYVNDNVVFEARLTGQGYKDLTVPVVLKVKNKDGKEEIVDRKMIEVDPTGKAKEVVLNHRPTKVGRKLYIMEVELPKADRPDKAIPPNNTRLERTIDVLDTKLIRVLYVENTPRYEFRFIKSLLERERPGVRKQRSIELKVVLLDADPDFAAEDRTALPDFPPTREELEAFDVVILGDCDPRHPRLGEKSLRLLADFVRGEDGRGKKSSKTGGGLLLIAGPSFNPHAYRDTPLAEVLPIEPADRAPGEPEQVQESYRLQLTPAGRQHPIFRLRNSDAENQRVWERLPPLYWFSEGYRIKPLAQVLAVHPGRDAEGKAPGQDPRHPLAIQQFVGSGRSLFFAFDESWRWRFRDNEVYFSKFWIQTIRYLSRTRLTRTTLRLDRQTPYRVGEPIKVTVRFPDNSPVPGKPDQKIDPKTEVVVHVEYQPPAVGNEPAEPEIQTMKLAKVEGSWSNFQGLFPRTREGKYHFWLSSPDVSQEDPTGQKPSANARVELPPGELDRLRMNQEEMTQAADVSRGAFYTLVNANQLLDDLPAGVRPSRPEGAEPFRLWNHALCFALVLFLLTSEWLLRKRKHLL